MDQDPFCSAKAARELDQQLAAEHGDAALTRLKELAARGIAGTQWEVPIHYRIAVLLHQRKQLQEALAHYRIAEVFFLQRNYQAAANAYREALNGDGEPRWTEVWSHIQLGKIFDITQQRERAVNEYRQALQTNDNTQNAMEEARKYLSSPYQRKVAKEGE